MAIEATPELPQANAAVARTFDDIADLLELQGENAFRIRAYRNAAREIRATSRDLAAMVADGDGLTQMRGIGADLAGKIRETVQTGHCALLDELHAELPASLHEVMRVPGLGPKRVRVLYERLGVRTVDELARAAADHRIQKLRGFGPKTERKITDALAGAFGTGRRMSLAKARPIAETLVADLRKVRGVKDVVVAGSYRRGRATIGDLDILAIAGPRSAVGARLAAHRDVARVLAKGPTRTAVVLNSGLQVDVRVVPPAAFGAALHYFTGSRAHNIAVRKLALARGLKLNEYGVFRGTRRIAGRTEAEVFAAVELPYVPPELRENRGEIEAAREHRLPALLERKHVRADVVLLAPWADERSTLARVLADAAARKLEYVVLLHEVDPTDADHRALRRRIATTAKLGASARIDIVQGIEIRAESNVEIPAALRRGVDLVVARLTIARASSKPSRASLSALRRLNPDAVRVVVRELADADEPDAAFISAVGPTLSLAHALVVDGTADQLAIAEPLLRWAVEHELPVLLGSGDATANALELVVSQARRAWVKPSIVLDALPSSSLRARLRARPRNRAGS